MTVTFFCTSIFAQQSGKQTTFKTVQNSFEKQYANSPEELLRYREWEAFTKQRSFPGGTFPDPEILIREYRDYRNTSAQARNSNPNAQAANWTLLGPNVVPANGGGAGRINCMTIDPTNVQNIWLGTACGGLWKTTDGGTTWSSNTDLLPALSISDIVIDPTNTQVMYLVTGDKYGIYYQNQTWGHYSAGILKSIDGGATWNTTGMTYALANVTLIQRLIIDPTNTNILFAATSSGIFKTIDGGTTWSNLRTGNYYDIEFNPTNDQIIYSGDSSSFIRSIDGGVNWNVISGVVAGGRISIGVTPANATVVYVWTVAGGFYYSNTSGASFIPKSDPSFAAQPYGYADKVLEVSPTNANVIFVGGLLIARSLNGGTNWSTYSSSTNYLATNYVHANEHALLFEPGSNTTIYSCNDGGISKTINQGTAWTDISNGLAIKQYYRLGSSSLTTNLIYAGAQGNGTDRITAVNSVTKVNGGEGMECLVDFTNDNIVFTSQENGAFFKSTDGGVTFTIMPVTGCDFTSPILMDPNDHNNLFVGGNDIFKSTDNGANWSNISTGSIDGTCIYSLEMSGAYPNYIYAATFGNIYRTIDAGVTWTNITNSLPVGSAAISGITISDINPDAAWVTLSGFSAGNKVYFTNDGGLSWTNYSGTLPNIPTNCIEYQSGSNNMIYIGTDLGVYYRDASMSDWLSYNTGMPNVIIDELEINYNTSKLRAATYGRGIWESNLQTSTILLLDASAYSIIYPPLTTCDSIIIPIVRIRNAGIDTLHTVEVHYKMDAQAWQMIPWAGTLATLGNANVSLPSYTLSPGVHSLEVYTANPNGSPDLNGYNDTIFRTFTVLSPNPPSLPGNLFEGFVSNLFPPPLWSSENSTNLWSFSATGGYGSSANSIVADFYNIITGSDMAITPYIDFTNALPPIRLYFDIAYAPYDSVSIDTLRIDLYNQCSGSIGPIYNRTTFQMNTVPVTGGVFIPNNSQWRTDTINLDSLAGHAPLQIRFDAISGYGNQLYLDNINLTANLVGISPIINNSALNIYPNPAAEEMTIQINCTGNSKIQIEVYDLLGNLIQEQDNNAKSGINKFQLDISTLQEGIYIVKIAENGKNVTQKISVVR